MELGLLLVHFIPNLILSMCKNKQEMMVPSGISIKFSSKIKIIQ